MTTAKQKALARSAATLISTLTLAPLPGHAASDTPPPKTLSPVVVKADEDAEASEYRVGGDVQVITREQIESRHFANVKEAIKRIPGVQISSPGYRAFEYGTTFGEEVSINGDSSVLITVDGRRLDNAASSYGGARSKSRTPLDVITNINAIERIEVIKGTGSAAYGSDAAGGIVNIVTRTGRDHQETTADVAAGSWQAQNYY